MCFGAKPQAGSCQSSFAQQLTAQEYSRQGYPFQQSARLYHYFSVFYQPLGIEHLFDIELPSLSGGELQRVFVAACLSKRADLYLIDEPAAFLDVEERIKIARIIRNAASIYNASVIAIEHDLQLADILGDRVMLFMGEPGVKGFTLGPMGKQEGMNQFLKELDITFRRDTETGRARINKKDSKLDREQRESGEFFFEKN